MLLSVAANAKEKPSEEELKALRQKIEQLQKNLSAAEESRGEAREGLRATEKAVSEAHRALFDLGQQQKAIEAEIGMLAGRASTAKSGISEQQALAERLLRLQHAQGAPDRLRMVLEGRDAAQVARHLHYLGYIQRARGELIQALRRNAQELATLEQETLERKAALDGNRVAQAEQARALEGERAARATLVRQLAGEVEKGRREIGRLKRDEARLTKLVEELARALARKAPAAPRPQKGRPVEQVADASLASKPFETLKGRLRLPVKGELTGRYGSPRDEGNTWKGVFIRAATGETVRAVADGRVVFADWLRGFGNLLILDHGARYMSLYAYNEGLLRQVGDSVRSGDPVAQVGASGGAGESGLYFELRHDGKPFDPLRWAAP